MNHAVFGKLSNQHSSIASYTPTSLDRDTVDDIIVYCATSDRSTLMAAAGSELRITIVSDEWPLCEAAIGANPNSCLVCVQRPFIAANAASRIAQIRGRYPECPVVVVTEPNVDAIRSLVSLAIDEIVWFNEVTAELKPAVRRASTRHVLHSVSSIVESLPDLAPLLREALLYAANAQEIVQSIKELTSFMRCSRATLWHHWTKAARADAPMRLEDYLGWVILMRAVMYKHSGSTWGAVANRLGIREQTLSRTLQRLTGEKPSQITNTSTSRIAALFHQQLSATFGTREL